jgi:predicted transcriptional regulator
MDEQKIIESLSPIERELLPHLTTTKKNAQELSETTKQDKTTTLRAASFLEQKGLIQTTTRKNTTKQTNRKKIFSNLRNTKHMLTKPKRSKSSTWNTKKETTHKHRTRKTKN